MSTVQTSLTPTDLDALEGAYWVTKQLVTEIPLGSGEERINLSALTARLSLTAVIGKFVVGDWLVAGTRAWIPSPRIVAEIEAEVSRGGS